MTGLLAAWAVSVAGVSAQSSAADAAKLKNPVRATAASIAAGKTAYDKYCKFCHAEGAVGNGPLAPKGTNPPNLADATWDHGSTDGEIFTSIRDGIGPKFDMKAMKGRMMDVDMWNVVNYLRSLAPKR
jgi:mono/diheme cytochrome c family protein